MRKAVPVALWAAIGLLPSAAAPSAVGEAHAPPKSAPRSLRLSNLHNFWYTNDSGWDSSKMMEVLARRSSICFTEHWTQVTPQAVKSINPTAAVYRLYDLMCKTAWDTDWSNPQNTSAMQTPLTKAAIDKDDWWLRDGSGSIVKENSQIWYLDVGKPGFKEAYLQSVLSRMSGKGFDGVVLDYWHYTITTDYFAIPGGWFSTHPMPKAYPTDQDWFEKAWRPFLEYVTSGLHKAGYRIIGNCAGEYGSGDSRIAYQRSLVDGTIYEQGAVDWAYKGGGWLPGPAIERLIQAISGDPLEVWVANDGVRKELPEYDRKQLVALAAYYIAIPVSQDKRSYSQFGDRKVGWEPIWDFYIGTPAEPAVKLPGKRFWSRKFTEGIVLLNYEDSERMIYRLDKRYRSVSGKAYCSDVTVRPHSALILALDD